LESDATPAGGTPISLTIYRQPPAPEVLRPAIGSTDRTSRSAMARQRN
jgi:hypothetical protein